MRETAWLEDTDSHGDPFKVLDLLRGKTSDRKLRLYEIACCRRVEHLLTHEDSRQALEVAERYADGLVREEEREQAALAAAAAYIPLGTVADIIDNDGNWYCMEGLDPSDRERLDGEYRAALLAARNSVPEDKCAVSARADAAQAAYITVSRSLRLGGYNAGTCAAFAVAFSTYPNYQSAYESLGDPSEFEFQRKLLKDLFANLKSPVTVVPTWLNWNDRTVSYIAQTIYQERAFDRLPVLADALEDAGCDNADILNHCRQPGEHVRGCWVVDLLLGKERTP